METGTITPLRDYLVLEQIKIEQNISGIILDPSMDTKESPRAKVISVGPDVKAVKEGQTVVYKPHLFDVFWPDAKSKEPFFIGQESAITAIIT